MLRSSCARLRCGANSSLGNCFRSDLSAVLFRKSSTDLRAVGGICATISFRGRAGVAKRQMSPVSSKPNTQHNAVPPTRRRRDLRRIAWYSRKQGEHVAMWSTISSASGNFRCRPAIDLRASDPGQPRRSGFGKPDLTYSDASSRSFRSSRRVNWLGAAFLVHHSGSLHFRRFAWFSRSVS
jgi:hypothetical protein